MATTFTTLLVTLVYSPQTTTLPSLLKAILIELPADTLTTSFNDAGTLHWPERLSPQATTLPSARTASEWLNPADIATTLVAATGIVICPNVFDPHATTSPASAGRESGNVVGRVGIESGNVVA